MTTASQIPPEFLLISEAINRLAQGMWGGLNRPTPVAEHKAHSDRRDESVIFGPWRQKAAQQMLAAATKGRLHIHVFADVQDYDETVSSSVMPNVQSAIVPVSVLGRLITWRGGFPDQAIRPTIKTAAGDQQLVRLLMRGLLVVREKEFSKWYRSERAKRSWPSQDGTRKPLGGRPSMQSAELRTAVVALANGGSWIAKDGIPVLRERLLERGYEVPSVRTLRRLLVQMYIESGVRSLRRLKGKRRKRSKP